MFQLLTRKRLPKTLEDRVALLDSCGIRMAPGRTIDELLISFTREEYESQSLGLLLFMLGSDVETGEFNLPFSTDVWTCDLECIVEPGDYARIAVRMRDIAHGDFPIENIRDDVDWEEQTAWLEFELDGKLVRLTPEFDDDWADPALFSELAKLLHQRRTGRRFIVHGLDGGQSILIGTATEDQMRQLRKRTRESFEWLE